MSKTSNLKRKILKILIWFFIVCFGFFVIASVFYAIPSIMGIVTIRGWCVYVMSVILLCIIPFFVTGFILGKFFAKHPFKHANEDELKMEDDVLLQATAFSQSALWIYLNMVSQNEYITVLKVIVPTIAILFYFMRAFAKIKNNTLWRYRSIYALSSVISVTFISVFLTVTMFEHWFENTLVIEGTDCTMIFLGVFVFIVFVTTLSFFLIALKKRYFEKMDSVIGHKNGK